MVNTIELKNINKVYGKRVKTHVLKDINLSIEKGTLNSIIGTSGSGKTTLLNIIGALDKPTSGQVYISGRRIDGMSKKELALIRNNKIGFVFQFHYLLPEFNVIENVLMPYTIKTGFNTKKFHERAEGLLDLVGLLELKRNKIYDLSGGQQQRVAIARALINNPEIILADEPTGSLDSHSTKYIHQMFRRINKELGTTFVIITHDEMVSKNTDRAIEIKDGHII